MHEFACACVRVCIQYMCEYVSECVCVCIMLCGVHWCVVCIVYMCIYKIQATVNTELLSPSLYTCQSVNEFI